MPQKIKNKIDKEKLMNQGAKICKINHKMEIVYHN